MVDRISKENMNQKLADIGEALYILYVFTVIPKTTYVVSEFSYMNIS